MAAIDRLNGLASETTLGIKAPCLVATTGANIPLAGVQSIDGVTVGNNNERVLVKDQTDQTTNGIYLASSGNWVYAQDAGGNTDWAQGTLVIVQTGAMNAGVLFSQMTAGPVIIGSTDIVFGQPFAGISTFKGTMSVTLSPSLGTSPLSNGVQAINTLQNVSGGVQGAAFNLNQFVLIEDINFTAAGAELIGWSFIHGVTAGATGNRVTLSAEMNVVGAMTTSADGNELVALQATMIVAASQSNSFQGFAFNPQIVIRPNLTGIFSAITAEVDVSVANGSSVSYIAGLSIAMINQAGFPGYTTTAHGTIAETAILVTAQTSTAGFNNIFLLGDWNGAGASPFASSGATVMGLVRNPGFKYGINFQGANPQSTDLSLGQPFSSGILVSSSPQLTFAVDWYGNIVAASVVGSGYSTGGVTNYLDLFAPGQVGSAIILGNNSDATLYSRSGVFKWQNFAASSTWMELFGSGGLYVGQTPADPGANNFAAQGNVRAVAVGAANAPSLIVGNATTGFYSVSTTGLGVAINGALAFDYGVSTGGILTSQGAISLPNSGLLFTSGGSLTRNGGSGTLTLSSNAGSIILAPAAGTVITVAATSIAVAAAVSLLTAASSTTRTGFNIASGSAPTSPNDGDMWYDGTNVKFRVGATTKTFTLT